MLQGHSIKNSIFSGANFGAYTDPSFEDYIDKNGTQNTKNAEVINEVIVCKFNQVTSNKIWINQEATQVHLHTKFEKNI